MTLCFIDTETTSLRHDRRVWEAGLIVRQDDGTEETYHWFVMRDDLDLSNADPFSLKIGRFYERHPEMLPSQDPEPGPRVDTEAQMLLDIEELTHEALIVGAVPWFDTDVLARRMRAYNLLPAWHYHLIDVENLAAGRLGMQPPWNFDKILAALGLDYIEEHRHTALGDAQMAKRAYDAVWTPPVALNIQSTWTATTGRTS